MQKIGKYIRRCCYLTLFYGGVLAAEEGKLSVSASAEVWKVPDLLQMSFGVVSIDRTLASALAENEGKMQAILQKLREIGLSPEEMRTDQFTIYPKLTPTPKNPSEDWSPTVIGYEVRNTVRVRTEKLGLVDQMISGVVQQGGNLFQDMAFSLQNEMQAQQEAIGAAFEKASGYAIHAAKEAGVSLGKILECNISQPFVQAKGTHSNRLMSVQDGGSALSPGSVEVSASISLIYQLK